MGIDGYEILANTGVQSVTQENSNTILFFYCKMTGTNGNNTARGCS
jgi:hypothetical protein